MKLTRLELSGFKSFADTVTLTFEQGVTAIVGPNGCGKSNVSDAVRWVLGEQSARLLRGGKMEDVIFQGSTARRPVNVTEVSLYLDNSDGDLPIAYREVVVTRRLSRSGQSDYLLNGSPVRLRDIQDLLRGTGLGSDAGVVIEAKMIDLLLSDRADERRSLFEEAAGIGLYRDRKHSTERRLEETATDLQRVEDLIAEVQSQIRSLARQRGKAERHVKLTEEKFAVQVTLARRLLERLERRGGGHGGPLRRAGRAAARRARSGWRDGEQRREDAARGRGRRRGPAHRDRAPARRRPGRARQARRRPRARRRAAGQRRRPPASGAGGAAPDGAARPAGARRSSDAAAADREAAAGGARRASAASWPAGPRPRRTSAAGWASSAAQVRAVGAGAADPGPDAALARGRARRAGRRAGRRSASAPRRPRPTGPACRASWPAPSGGATSAVERAGFLSHEAKRAAAEAERARHLVAEAREQEAMHRADRRQAEEALAQMTRAAPRAGGAGARPRRPGARRRGPARRPRAVRRRRARPAQRFREHRPGRRRAGRAPAGRLDARRAGARPARPCGRSRPGTPSSSPARSCCCRSIPGPVAAREIAAARRPPAGRGAGRRLGPGGAGRLRGARRRRAACSAGPAAPSSCRGAGGALGPAPPPGRARRASRRTSSAATAAAGGRGRRPRRPRSRGWPSGSRRWPTATAAAEQAREAERQAVAAREDAAPGGRQPRPRDGRSPRPSSQRRHRAAHAARSSGWRRSTPRWSRASWRAAGWTRSSAAAAGGSPSSRPSRRRPASSGCTGRCRRRTWPAGSASADERLQRAATMRDEAERGRARAGRRAGPARGRHRRAGRAAGGMARSPGRAAGGARTSSRRPAPRPRPSSPRPRRRSADAEREVDRRARGARGRERGEPHAPGAADRGRRRAAEHRRAGRGRVAPAVRPADRARRPLLDLDLETLEAEAARIVAALEAIGPVNPLAVEEHAEEVKRLEFLTTQRDDLVGRPAVADPGHPGDRRHRPHHVPRDLHRRPGQLQPRCSRPCSAAASASSGWPIRTIRSRARSTSTPRPAGKRTQRIHLLSSGERTLVAVSPAVQHLSHQAQPVLPHGRGGRPAGRRQRGPVHPPARRVQGRTPSSWSSPTIRGPCRRPTRCTA